MDIDVDYNQASEHLKLSKKQLLFAAFLMLLTGVLVKFIVTPTLYTFTSKAYEEPKTIIYSQESFEVATLPESDTPACVSYINYLTSDPVCYVEFQCIEKGVPVESLPQNCSYIGDSIVCDAPNDSCKSLRDWKNEFKDICGC